MRRGNVRRAHPSPPCARTSGINPGSNAGAPPRTSLHLDARAPHAGAPRHTPVHRELAGVGVTMKLLTGEYLDAAAGAGKAAMSCDRFCRLYADYTNVIGSSSSVGHKAARGVEVDWLG